MLFKDIKLIEPIQKALVKSGYTKATPIQERAIPQILEGKDLFGIAQTGTGKTAAFTLPILQLMHKQNKTSKLPRTLILTPTRELAAQIGDNIKDYGAFTNFKQTVVFGGVAQGPQEKAIRRGCDIIIATPGRLLDLVEQKIIDLSTIEFLILDEADRMLDMGFINDVKKIMSKMPKKKQTLLFSATMSKTITELANKFLRDPQTVKIKPEATTIEKIEQGLYFVDKNDKDRLLLNIIKPKNIKSVLVFTRTKHKANKIAKFLTQNGIGAEAIHGNKSQNQRTETLSNFKSARLKVLVATEIVARGIDIDNISHVINYEIPNEPESYVHRIGRTARAGTRGIAYSFAAADERHYVHEIEKIIKKSIPILDHDRHSETAQNARGADAKPIPKQQLHGKNPNKNLKKNQKKKIDINEERKKIIKGNSENRKYSNKNKTSNNSWKKENNKNSNNSDKKKNFSSDKNKGKFKSKSNNNSKGFKPKTNNYKK